MIDPSILKIADDRIRLELDGEVRRRSREIEGALARWASRGMGGNMVAEAIDISAKAAEERADLAWRIMHRTVTSANVEYSDALESDLKDAVAKYLPNDGLISHVSEIVRRTGIQNPNVLAQVSRDIETAGNRARRRTFNEIELFVASLKGQVKASKEGAAAPVFNVYAPVGAIQTGSHAVATVSLSIDTGSRQKLDEALASLQAALAQIEVLPNTPKGEIVEIIQDARTEVAKPQPNASKLRSLLSTAGGAVRTVGALKPAYEVLKQIAESVGISMP